MAAATEDDMADIAERLDDLADKVAGLDAAEAADKADIMRRLRVLAARVARLEERGR